LGASPVLPELITARAGLMNGQKITKRIVNAIKPNCSEYTLWDSLVTGFGIRVRPSGAKTYVVVYRGAQGEARQSDGLQLRR
jgi:hypothetical protein